MKTLLIVFMLFFSIKSNGQNKMPNPLERKPLTISFSTEKFEYIMPNIKTGMIHWIMKNGKDSVITKQQAKQMVKKWRYDAVPKYSV